MHRLSEKKEIVRNKTYRILDLSDHLTFDQSSTVQF